MLDLGANVECSSENLFQFAVMGEVFAGVMLGVGKPRVRCSTSGPRSSRATTSCAGRRRCCATAGC